LSFENAISIGFKSGEYGGRLSICTKTESEPIINADGSVCEGIDKVDDGEDLSGVTINPIGPVSLAIIAPIVTRF